MELDGLRKIKLQNFQTEEEYDYDNILSEERRILLRDLYDEKGKALMDELVAIVEADNVTSFITNIWENSAFRTEQSNVITCMAFYSSYKIVKYLHFVQNYPNVIKDVFDKAIVFGNVRFVEQLWDDFTAILSSSDLLVFVSLSLIGRHLSLTKWFWELFLYQNNNNRHVGFEDGEKLFQVHNDNSLLQTAFKEIFRAKSEKLIHWCLDHFQISAILLQKILLSLMVKNVNFTFLSKIMMKCERQLSGGDLMEKLFFYAVACMRLDMIRFFLRFSSIRKKRKEEEFVLMLFYKYNNVFLMTKEDMKTVLGKIITTEEKIAVTICLFENFQPGITILLHFFICCLTKHPDFDASFAFFVFILSKLDAYTLEPSGAATPYSTAPFAYLIDKIIYQASSQLTSDGKVEMLDRVKNGALVFENLRKGIQNLSVVLEMRVKRTEIIEFIQYFLMQRIKFPKDIQTIVLDYFCFEKEQNDRINSFVTVAKHYKQFQYATEHFLL